MGGSKGAAAFRQIAGEAIKACGKHVQQGSAVYSELCAFEMENLASTLREHGINSVELMEAAKCASAAWGKRLGAVLADGQSGMAEFLAWRQSLPEALHEAVTPQNLDKVLFLLLDTRVYCCVKPFSIELKTGKDQSRGPVIRLAHACLVNAPLPPISCTAMYCATPASRSPMDMHPDAQASQRMPRPPGPPSESSVVRLWQNLGSTCNALC
jgi:hypothetical protein